MRRVSSGWNTVKQMAHDQMVESGLVDNFNSSLATNKGVPATHRGATICGYLMRKKQSRGALQAAYVKRWYSLQGKKLLCFEDESCPEPKKERTIHLEEVTSITETDSSVMKFDFIISTRGEKGTEQDHKLKADHFDPDSRHFNPDSRHLNPNSCRFDADSRPCNAVQRCI